MKKTHLIRRIAVYLLGLFIMTLGISLAVKSNLGAAPVSSIPYTMTLCFSVEMGLGTILFHAFLVLLQIIILRKNFKIKNLLQVLVGIIFGYFTTFCNFLFRLLPDTDNLIIRVGMILVSAFLIAVGIFFYLPADIVPLAAEGLNKTISDQTGIAFNRIKIGFDVTVVAVSLIVSLIFLGNIGSVGLGTVIDAVLVGVILGFLNRHFHFIVEKLLAGTKRDDTDPVQE